MSGSSDRIASTAAVPLSTLATISTPGFGAEQILEPLARERLVVHDQHADRAVGRPLSRR